MNKIFLKTTLGHEIAVYIYDDVENPKAVIQIVHGASEHFTRYEELISFLNRNGYLVIGNDILGHGDSCHADGNYIYFEKDEAFESIVMVKEYVEKTYSHLPFYLLGHSMGSFLARKLLIDYPQTYSKAIISGTTSMGAMLIGSAVLLSKITRVFRGPKGISPLLNALGMGNLPKALIKDKLMTKDEMWITHDIAIGEYYRNSPICGEDFTVSSYQGMFSWISYVSKEKNILKGNNNIPILFISGNEDPLSHYGKDIEKTVKLYQKAGYSFVDANVYEHMRHEVLNEIDREKVYNDCLRHFNS